MVNIMMSNERKAAILLGVLPVIMDYMEDIKEELPRIYSKKVKKTGNDFNEELDKHMRMLFDGVKGMDGHIDFYDQIQDISTSFMQWANS